MSALQMLASIPSDKATADETQFADETTFGIPEFAPAAPVVSDVNIGTWKVALPGNQTVVLVLQDDGRFAWTATKSGATSTFEGNFQLDGQQLTLVRSSDQQQMRGTWTANNAGFLFKLDGATTGGLAFTR